MLLKCLKQKKITLDDKDKISPSKDNELQNGLKVAITRVDAKIETKLKI